jgi:hypothetical protein
VPEPASKVGICICQSPARDLPREPRDAPPVAAMATTAPDPAGIGRGALAGPLRTR